MHRVSCSVPRHRILAILEVVSSTICRRKLAQLAAGTEEIQKYKKSQQCHIVSELSCQLTVTDIDVIISYPRQ